MNSQGCTAETSQFLATCIRRGYGVPSEVGQTRPGLSSRRWSGAECDRPGIAWIHRDCDRLITSRTEKVANGSRSERFTTQHRRRSSRPQSSATFHRTNCLRSQDRGSLLCDTRKSWSGTIRTARYITTDLQRCSAEARGAHRLLWHVTGRHRLPEGMASNECPGWQQSASTRRNGAALRRPSRSSPIRV
jgi:hypothetical protein